MDKVEFLERFGRRVAEIRKKKGITQEQLADSIEVHRTYVGFIEQGKRNPLIFNVSKLAKALDVTLAELFSGI